MAFLSLLIDMVIARYTSRALAVVEDDGDYTDRDPFSDGEEEWK